MPDYTLGAMESQFADIIWQNEPLSSSELARRSENLLNWKKSTSFTVLKRLCNKGIFQSENGIVTSRISRQDFYSMQSEHFVNELFQGSLPAFLTAFAARRSLNPEDIAELRRMVDEYHVSDFQGGE